MDQRKSKDFSDLPLEVRCTIYTAYSKDLVVTYPSLTPPLLLTSKRIRVEARPYFYRYATLDLVNTEYLVDYMSSIPRSTLTALRHVSFCPYQLGFSMKGPFDFVPRIDDILVLCDGLQLDTLELQSKPGGGSELSIMSLDYQIRDLATCNAGFKHLKFTVGHCQSHQLKVERHASNLCPGSNSYNPSPTRHKCEVPGLKIKYDTKFTVTKCMTDKGNDCVQKDWRDQTGSAVEEAWKAEHGPILYGLRITRDAISDTVTTDVEDERAWTIQDFRREMDRSLVVGIRQAEHGEHDIYTLGRGKSCREATINQYSTSGLFEEPAEPV